MQNKMYNKVNEAKKLAQRMWLPAKSCNNNDADFYSLVVVNVHGKVIKLKSHPLYVSSNSQMKVAFGNDNHILAHKSPVSLILILLFYINISL